MVTAVVSVQCFRTVEGDRGLTLVTGAFPAVVTVVVSDQRLCTVEGDGGLTLVTGAFPAVVTADCERPALENF